MLKQRVFNADAATTHFLNSTHLNANWTEKEALSVLESVHGEPGMRDCGLFSTRVNASRGQRVNQLHQCAARGLDYRDGDAGRASCRLTNQISDFSFLRRFDSIRSVRSAVS